MRSPGTLHTVLVSASVSLAVLFGYHALTTAPRAEAASQAQTTAQTTEPDGTDDVLTLSELRIVDENGVVRARLGVDLPDAVIGGRRLDRGGKPAGLLLYDETGHERGGYVTMEPGSNVMLTLDNR